MENSNLPLDTIISFKDAKIYQQDHLVFSNVNLEIGRGEFVYLIGKVGSGKTSLVKTINGQIPLGDGEALVAGYDLSGLKRKEIPLLREEGVL